jgi:HK97 family phage major capsid protein
MSNCLASTVVSNAIVDGRELSPKETALVLRATNHDEEVRAIVNGPEKGRAKVAALHEHFEARTEPAQAGKPESRSEGPAEEARAEELREERTAVQRAAIASAGAAGKVTEERQAFTLPTIGEYRALSVSSPSAGGYLVPIGQANQVFDLLRANSVVLGSGVRVLPMDSQTLNVPRIATATAVAMVAEGANIAPTDAVFAQTVLSAKKAAAFTLVSNESLEDSNPAIRQVVTEDHLKAVALFLDNQFLAGSGTGQNLKGIRNMTGISTTSMGTNGASLTLDALADAAGRLEGNNGNLATAVWFMSGRSWASIRKVKDSQQRYQIAPDPTQAGQYTLFGIPVKISNQISNTETVGTSTDCSWISLVDTTQVVIGQRRDVTVTYDTSYAFNADQTAIRTTSRVDIGLLDPKGVELVTGVRP